MKTFILGILLTIFAGIYYVKFYTPGQVQPQPQPKVTAALPSQIKTQMYHWIDENGVQQFSQTPPDDENIEADIMEVVSEAEPENPVLMYSEGLKGKPIASQGSGSAKMVRSARQPHSTACKAAKRRLRSVRTESYKNRNAHLNRVNRYKSRVKSAC